MDLRQIVPSLLESPKPDTQFCHFAVYLSILENSIYISLISLHLKAKNITLHIHISSLCLHSLEQQSATFLSHQCR